MATPDGKFGPLAVDEFCSNLSKVVADFGGSAGFFAKLETDSATAFANLEVKHYGIFSRLLDDVEFRRRFVRGISEESDRRFLERFLEA